MISLLIKRVIMMEFSDILALYNSLYTKVPINFIPEHSIQTNIMFTKWVIREPELVNKIKPLFQYIFTIKPKHYYYLLFTHIPKRAMAPKIKKYNKVRSKKEDAVILKMREIFDWTAGELEIMRGVVDKTIMKEKKFWQREFGVK